MTEMQAQLDKIRSDAAECLVLSSLAKSERKEMFAKMAEHLNGLALELEKKIAVEGAHLPFVEHRSPEFITDLSPVRDEPAASNASSTAYQARRSRRLLPWLLVVVAALIIGVFFRTNENAKKLLSLLAVQSKQERPLLPQNDAKQVRLLSNEERERSLIAEQLGALAARVGSFEKALENFKRVPGEADVNGSSRADETTAALTSNLAAARRDLETKTALLNRASDEAAQFKKTAEATTAALQEERKKTAASLQQEQERAGRLEADLAAARREVEKQTTLAAKASEDASQLKQAAEQSSAELKRSLQKEHERAEALANDLSMAHTAIYAYEAQARKASDQAADSQQARENGAAALRKSLQQEQERAGRLEQDLAAARRDAETQTALATKANEETARSKRAAEHDSAEWEHSLQKEHERAEALAQSLSMVHTAIYAYEVQARMASDQAAHSQQAAENEAAELRKSLRQEQERTAQLQQDLMVARREAEIQAGLAAKASAEAATLNQAGDDNSAETLRSLQQEREKSPRLERELASERKATIVEPAASGATTTGQVAEDRRPGTDAIRPAAATQTAAAAARSSGKPDPKNAAEVARLVARASLLLGQGDIGSARIVLERAAATGNAQASFALAETYDPLVLGKWGAYGTLGDAAKARDLYARAQAGGVKEARERFDALRR